MRKLLFMIVILGLWSCTYTVKGKVKVSDLKDSTSALLVHFEPLIIFSGTFNNEFRIKVVE